MHQLFPVLRLKCAIAACVLVTALAIAGCGSRKDASFIGTFRMGEKVQAGPLTYNVLEAEWKPELGEPGESLAPKNRYLLVRLSIANSGGQALSVPGFVIQGAGGKSYTEVTDGMDKVQNWLGLLRNIAPSATEEGYIVFDAPVGAYKLVVSDAGEVGAEKHAHVEIPVHLD